jgi:hypothetical protein
MEISRRAFLENRKMIHKTSSRVAVLLMVAAIFFFGGRGASARTQLPATEIPQAQSTTIRDPR